MENLYIPYLIMLYFKNYNSNDYTTDNNINDSYINNSLIKNICEKKNYNHIKNNLNIDKFSVMIIKYSINNNSLRLFGENFVGNNIDNCYLLIDGLQTEICTYLTLNKEQIKKMELEIKLIGIKKIKDMSWMFNGCQSLINILDASKWDTKNVTNMSHMFHWCDLLHDIPDISEWDTQNVTDLSYMFYNCQSIKTLPDISKWNTQNVTDLSYMFYWCDSIRTLPI